MLLFLLLSCCLPSSLADTCSEGMIEFKAEIAASLKKVGTDMETSFEARIKDVQDELSQLQAGLPRAISNAVRDFPYFTVCAYRYNYISCSESYTRSLIPSFAGISWTLHILLFTTIASLPSPAMQTGLGAGSGT